MSSSSSSSLSLSAQPQRPQHQGTSSSASCSMDSVASLHSDLQTPHRSSSNRTQQQERPLLLPTRTPPLVLNPSPQYHSSQQQQQQQRRSHRTASADLLDDDDYKSTSSTSFPSSSDAVRNTLQAAAAFAYHRTPKNPATTPTVSLSTTTTATPTAAMLARTAPCAGYLSQLVVDPHPSRKKTTTTTTTPTTRMTFQKRFFVLKPSTHLYSFASCTDTIPSGCIDLTTSLTTNNNDNDNKNRSNETSTTTTTTSSTTNPTSTTTIQDVHELPDGRVRFALVWNQQPQPHNEEPQPPPPHNEEPPPPQQQPQQRLILMARDKIVAQTWMERLQTERLDMVQAQVQHQQEALQQAQEALVSWQQEVRGQQEETTLAELDAARYKRRLEQLNEGVRLLLLYLRRGVEETNCSSRRSSSSSGHVECESSDKEDSYKQGGQPKAKESSDETDESPVATATTTTTAMTTTPHREMSLLDSVSANERPIDEIDIPGTHFSGLTNVCQQLRESVRLASVEAASAVEDLQAANEKLRESEKRMGKAERHICKLWEENCDSRKSLKESKREKRILVKEVKKLQALLAEKDAVMKHHRQQQQLQVVAPPQDRPVSHDCAVQTDASSIRVAPNDEEGERLVEEIEEHVISSIRLHEQLLGVHSGLGHELSRSVQKIESGTYSEISPARANQTFESDVTRRIENLTDLTGGDTSTPTRTTSRSVDETRGSGFMSPLLPTALSLFDEESDDNGVEPDEHDEDSKGASVVSSVGAEYGEEDADAFHSGPEKPPPQSRPDAGVLQSRFDQLMDEDSDSDESVSLNDNSPTRKHPLIQLDEPDDTVPPNLCGSSTQSESSKSVVTDTGQATSRLACPLADVVETKQIRNVPEAREDGRVYHLTFYSRKIGLQFQKVPAEESTTGSTSSSTSRGLLTDAMTADLPSHAIKATGAETTAAELQRIAALSSRLAANQSNTHKKSNNAFSDTLQVATPVHAVLVCGFHGFDDTGNRPKLGARLVAFDGISVEVGKWTFDSVRKAIKARGRPLTLSFRNDFLTTTQRSILTRAVAEIQAALPPPPLHATISSQQQEEEEEGQSLRTEMAGMSVPCREMSASMHHEHPPAQCVEDDDWSVSVASSSRGGLWGRSFSASHSVASASSAGNHSSSVAAHKNMKKRKNYRSFSNASSAISSTVIGPLLSSLLPQTKDRTETDAPDDIPPYLRHDVAESLENTAYYDDFRSSLL